MIRIAVAGPRGKMSTEAIKMITKVDSFQLVAAIDYKHGGKKLNDLGDFSVLDVPVYADCISCFSKEKIDVLVDFTTPEMGKKNTEIALEHRVRPVVGTTGFTETDIKQLSELAKSQKMGGLIAPNFALGAVLMMKFAKMAAKYYQDIEIIELHHDQKLDAPSGTAIKTAEMMTEVRSAKKQGHPEEKETIAGARGADFDGMHIHSIRLPGLVAHQQVLFGNTGELLTIRHDSFHRSSFMTGVKMSIETVMKIDELVYGLENIVD